jgi:hypothetical protein
MSDVQTPPAIVQKKSRVGLIVLISLLAVAILATGGWFIACYIATEKTRAVIDESFQNSPYAGAIHYDRISATPFNSVTLSGVHITNPDTGLESYIERVEGSYSPGDDDLSGALTMAFYGIEESIKEIVELDPSQAEHFAPLLELGYDTLRADIELYTSYDQKEGTGTTAVRLKIDDMLDASLELSLASLDLKSAQQFQKVMLLPEEQRKAAAQKIAMQVMFANAGMQLSELKMAFDTSGIYNRMQTSEKWQKQLNREIEAVSQNVDSSLFILAGQTPEQAEASRQVVIDWISKGGNLRFTTDIKEPMQLASVMNNQGGMDFLKGLNFTLSR